MKTLTFGSLGAAALLSGCALDPSMFPDYPAAGGNNNQEQVQQAPAPSREFVKAMEYQSFYGPGQISYYRTTNSPDVGPNKTRICLQNATGQPKKLVWVSGDHGTNDLVAKKNGDRSCANQGLSQRLQFTFVDRIMPAKSSAMNIGGVGGTLIEFIWVKDY